MKYIHTLIYTTVVSLAISAQAPNLTSAALGKMEARHIGPAVMSGRTTCIDGVNTEPRILYIGAAGGGVWKSTNGGASFMPVFDKHCQSIGAIAIDQQHPDVVWVGTGESNMRNTVSIGNGIYKSIDGGENWVSMGLPKTEHISKVIVHPTQSDIVYAAAPGPLWSDSRDRGLYKTTDGGKTWSNIMESLTDASTGCADVVMNSKNPDILYASTWTFRRKPYSFFSGGNKGGLYKSTDGGKTWVKSMNGIKVDSVGRIAIAISPSAPENLVAIVEAKKTQLYISADGGVNWKQQSADDNVTARPFYFSCIAIDPLDPKRVYRPAFEFSISKDGGYSWSRAQQSSGWVHSDMHGFWINPHNTEQMYVATDGGVYMSVDRGNNWLHLKNLPVSQLYHVQTDDAEPYHVYCGLQDNGSWMAPNRKEGGVKNGDWQNVGGGDGFWVQPDRENNKIVYSEYQGGHVSKNNLITNQGQDIQPQPLAGEEKLRWNWNTPIYCSPNSKKRIYMGAQYLYRSDNRGITWERVSTDLTTNDPLKKKQEESGGVTVDNTSAENHCTIFTIAESPLDANLLCVGTDDGNLQVSRDAGKTWVNVSKQIAASGVPAQTWVSSIELSHFDRNVMYATFDNHMYGDMATYIAKTSDGGSTWRLLSSKEFKGFAHRVKEDLVNPKLLFLGTEMGLYMSTNGGADWLHFRAHVPDYALVRDIVIEPRTNDLILATHGRGILIVDDISPLRGLDDKVLTSEAAFIPTKPTAVCTGHLGWSSGGDAGQFTGPNPTEEAELTYYLHNRINSGTVKIEIYDPTGKFLLEKTGTKRKGINKVNWDMRSQPPHTAEGGAHSDWTATIGPLVHAGKYTLKLKIADKIVAEGALNLVPDKNTDIVAADRDDNYAFVANVMSQQETLATLMDSVLKQLNPLKEAIKANSTTPDAEIKEYYDTLENVRATLVSVKEGTAITGEEKIRDKLSDLYAGVIFYEGKPTDSQADRLKGLKQEIQNARVRFNGHVTKYSLKVNKKITPTKTNPY
jgi:photosystem II stability/assembly factor-like uncharacterized protein